MNLTRTITVLAGVAALCAVTTAAPAVATTALVTAGIGLLGGLPVIDAREGRRKRFEDNNATVAAYRDLRQTSSELQCCQSEGGSFYSNFVGVSLWETCESIGKRRGEKLVKVPPQTLKAFNFNLDDGSAFQKCLGPKAASKVNVATEICQLGRPDASLAVDFLALSDNNIIGVLGIGQFTQGLNTRDCGVSFPILPEPPTSEPPTSDACTEIASDLSTMIGVAGAAAVVARNF